MMIPFLGIGSVQLTERTYGNPNTADNLRLIGNDGTENRPCSFIITILVFDKIACLMTDMITSFSSPGK